MFKAKLPFLLAAYLLIEWLEHRAGTVSVRFEEIGRLGPLIGGLLGLPQCGFSVVCANFMQAALSMGTVIAVMLATSDEALPLLLTEGIGNGMQIAEILLLLATKLVIGVAAGFAVDAVSSVYRAEKRRKRRRMRQKARKSTKRMCTRIRSGNVKAGSMRSIRSTGTITIRCASIADARSSTALSGDTAAGAQAMWAPLCCLFLR